MSVTQPQDMNEAFAAAYNSGDVEQLLALYEPDAMLAPQPGERAVGTEAIRSALEALLRLGGRMHAENRLCMQLGDVALLRGAWHLSGKGADGEPVEVRATSAEIARRQPDGQWLYAIDHPFGIDEAA